MNTKTKIKYAFWFFITCTLTICVAFFAKKFLCMSDGSPNESLWHASALTIAFIYGIGIGYIANKYFGSSSKK